MEDNMKIFSIVNKSAVKANNKQAGIVFLEYVIMAFIVTVAVICALWWFYWHLQQMTWEVKQKLETLKTLTCPLEPPYGAAPGDQPGGEYVPGQEVTSEFIFSEELPSPDPHILSTTYRKQRVTFYNMDPGSVAYTFGVEGEDHVAYTDYYDGTVTPIVGEIGHFDLIQSTTYGPNYEVVFGIRAEPPYGSGYPLTGPPTYYVTITDIGP